MQHYIFCLLMVVLLVAISSGANIGYYEPHELQNQQQYGYGYQNSGGHPGYYGQQSYNGNPGYYGQQSYNGNYGYQGQYYPGTYGNSYQSYPQSYQGYQMPYGSMHGQYGSNNYNWPYNG